jgi:hypothetical protein
MAVVVRRVPRPLRCWGCCPGRKDLLDWPIACRARPRCYIAWLQSAVAASAVSLATRRDCARIACSRPRALPPQGSSKSGRDPRPNALRAANVPTYRVAPGAHSDSVRFLRERPGVRASLKNEKARVGRVFLRARRDSNSRPSVRSRRSAL